MVLVLELATQALFKHLDTRVVGRDGSLIQQELYSYKFPYDCYGLTATRTFTCW